MNRRAIVMAVAALTLSACASTPNVQSDATPGVNFSKYPTFSWVNAMPPTGLNPVAWERVRLDIEGALTTKGYAKADPGSLAVILTLGAQDKTDISTYGRWGRQMSVYQYTQGTISVDVFDAKTKQPLWHGKATQQIDPDKPNQALIDAAVAGVMAKFPART